MEREVQCRNLVSLSESRSDCQLKFDSIVFHIAGIRFWGVSSETDDSAEYYNPSLGQTNRTLECINYQV